MGTGARVVPTATTSIYPAGVEEINDQSIAECYLGRKHNIPNNSIGIIMMNARAQQGERSQSVLKDRQRRDRTFWSFHF
jgi:hypothetical protein